MAEHGEFTHLDQNGAARMVDVGEKQTTARRAVARCEVQLSPQTMALLQTKALPKGDVLAVARIAGIQAAKKTSELIPLCHPLFLTGVDVDFEIDAPNARVLLRAEARTCGQTGVEMEALTAVQVAALTIYDMCKAIQKDIHITNCRLTHKSGGRSGVYEAA